MGRNEPMECWLAMWEEEDDLRDVFPQMRCFIG
jgi:hypothetical protein